MMPMPLVFAHRLTKRLAEARKNKEIEFLRPDGKSQVTIKYENNRPTHIDTIVLSTQHKPDISHEEIEKRRSKRSFARFFPQIFWTAIPAT